MATTQDIKGGRVKEIQETRGIGEGVWNGSSSLLGAYNKNIEFFKSKKIFLNKSLLMYVSNQKRKKIFIKELF